MGLALFLSVATHAILIFGVGFKLLATPPAAPTLEVTIAQYRSETAPDHADFIAQTHQWGSGDQPEATTITTDRLAPAIGGAAPALPRHAARAPAPADAIAVTAPAAEATPPPEAEPGEPAEQIGDADEMALRLEIGGLQARLAERQREYARFPRTLRLTAANAKSADEAAYLARWVDRVEYIGNRHYPEEARRLRIRGEVRLAVTLRRDGSVAAIDILQGSGQRLLDQAAVRTVRLAAPFTQFPAEMRNWDQLEIIRTWRFVPGERLHTR